MTTPITKSGPASHESPRASGAMYYSGISIIPNGVAHLATLVILVQQVLTVTCCYRPCCCKPDVRSATIHTESSDASCCCSSQLKACSEQRGVGLKYGGHLDTGAQQSPCRCLGCCCCYNRSAPQVPAKPHALAGSTNRVDLARFSLSQSFLVGPDETDRCCASARKMGPVPCTSVKTCSTLCRFLL